MSSRYAKHKSRIFKVSMNPLKVWAAFRRPKDIKGNSKRLKGVVMVAFWMWSGWTGIWWYAPHEGDYGKDGTTRKMMGVILDVWNRIPVRDGSAFRAR